MLLTIVFIHLLTMSQNGKVLAADLSKRWTTLIWKKTMKMKKIAFFHSCRIPDYWRNWNHHSKSSICSVDTENLPSMRRFNNCSKIRLNCSSLLSRLVNTPFIHCVIKFINIFSSLFCSKNDLSRYSIIAGLTNIKEKREDSVFEIGEVQCHSAYNPVNQDNDICLLKIKKEFKFSETVQPIKLPTKSSKLKDGDSVTVCGWGQTDVYIIIFVC